MHMKVAGCAPNEREADHGVMELSASPIPGACVAVGERIILRVNSFVAP